MKKVFALAAIVGGLMAVGVVSASTGALPAPKDHDSYVALPGAQLLQVTPEPWGAGFVQSVPKYRMDCPLACLRSYGTGATVTLVATPSTGWTFVGWQVADHGTAPTDGVCPGTGPCTVTMSAAKDVVALFDGPTPQPVGVDNSSGRRGEEQPD
ncbi:MAG TPA: hypothetical protein VFB35_05815 [Gaiellaceae bacterium]|nr:hypothetical protein [Gaiellaceae bacterium]